MKGKCYGFKIYSEEYSMHEYVLKDIYQDMSLFEGFIDSVLKYGNQNTKRNYQTLDFGLIHMGLKQTEDQKFNIILILNQYVDDKESLFIMKKFIDNLNSLGDITKDEIPENATAKALWIELEGEIEIINSDFEKVSNMRQAFTQSLREKNLYIDSKQIEEINEGKFINLEFVNRDKSSQDVQIDDYTNKYRVMINKFKAFFSSDH